MAEPRRADLHVHTTASDGAYTPSQVVALARQAGLAAVAVTDHDTLAGVRSLLPPSPLEGEGPGVRGGFEEFPSPGSLREPPSPPRGEGNNSGPHPEIIPGVEISTAFAGRELHLLGYFVRPDHAELNATLVTLCDRRRERFRDYVARLAARGTVIPADRAELVEARTVSLGRRHVAELLLACGLATTRNEAFGRFLGPLTGQVLPKQLVPIEDAIGLVHAAGGVASLAHPPAHLTDDDFTHLMEAGLDAVEIVYPWGRHSPANRLREIAARFGFAVSGGSDCHGPDPAHRRIGSHAISSDELTRLRDRCERAGRTAPAITSGC